MGSPGDFCRVGNILLLDMCANYTEKYIYDVCTLLYYIKTRLKADCECFPYKKQKELKTQVTNFLEHSK